MTPSPPDPAPEMLAREIRHTRTGNCWDTAKLCRRCGEGELCDVCHKHDEPRGSCSECPNCEACDLDESCAGKADFHGH